MFHFIITRSKLDEIGKDRIGDEEVFYNSIVDKFKKQQPEIYNSIVQNIMAQKNLQFEPDDLEIFKALENDGEFKKFYTNQIYKNKDELKFYTGDMPTVQTAPGTTPRTDQVPQEDDNLVDLSFNSFVPIANLMMPVTIDDFLLQSFKEVGKDVENLYTSLDNFKDSLEEYYLSDTQDPTIVNEKFKNLEGSFEEAFIEKKEEIT